jgi:hypothetical protein
MAAHGHPGGPGIWKHKQGSSINNKADVPVVDVSYQNDDLAGLIVNAWNDNPPGLYNSLTVGTIAQRTQAAQAALANLPNKPIGLAQPIVIREDEYNDGWECDNDDQVVFVLPNESRNSGVDLLETARLLMACVPNGI